MNIQLNHTIVWCNDKQKSAAFLAEILGLPEPAPFGPFLVVELTNDVSLDFKERDGPITSQHYAFLIGEDEVTTFSTEFASAGLSIGLIPAETTPVRSIITTAVAECTLKIPTVTFLRSSPDLTAPVGSLLLKPLPRKFQPVRF